MFEGRIKAFETEIKEFVARNAETRALERQQRNVKNNITPTGRGRKGLQPKVLDSGNERRSYLDKETWQQRGTRVAQPTGEIGHFRGIPYIRWGDKATDPCNVKFTNTCTLDNIMMVFAYLYLKEKSFRTFLSSAATIIREKMSMVVILLTSSPPRVNEARLYWIQSIAEKQVEPNITMWGEEAKWLATLQSLNQEYVAEFTCADHGLVSRRELILFGIVARNVEEAVRLINSGGRQKKISCTTCHRVCRPQVLQPASPLPVMAIDVGAVADCDSVPKQITVLGVIYTLVACSVHLPGHFALGFFHGGSWYEYDGLNLKSIRKGKPKHSSVSCAWYKIVE